MLYVFVSSPQSLLRACVERSEEEGGTYGDSLSDHDKLTQIKAVKGCLAAGVPLNALGNPVFQKFLAHVGVNLPSSGHLAEHIPLILKEEVRTLKLPIKNKGGGLCLVCLFYKTVVWTSAKFKIFPINENTQHVCVSCCVVFRCNFREQQAKIRDEMGDRPYALCFDATPYLCECFGVGVRFVNASGQVLKMLMCCCCRSSSEVLCRVRVRRYRFRRESSSNSLAARETTQFLCPLSRRVFVSTFSRQVAQRVLRLSMLKKSMTADDIAGEVTRIVTHEYGLDPDKCRAIMGDSCAANLVAMDALAKVFRYAVVIGCLSHTFNNIGKQLSTPELDTFLGKMHTLLSHSAGAKALFKEKVGVRAPSTPGHRWGSRFDRDYIIAMNWPGVLKFIAAYESADTDKSKAAKFMTDELVRTRDDNKAQSLVLQLQLALMVDVGRSVTSATIILEGDEPLVCT